MVGCRVRSGADLCVHFGALCAGANAFCCCEGRRFQTTDEDIRSEETFEHGSQIESGDFDFGDENPSRLAGDALKIQHSRSGS